MAEELKKSKEPKAPKEAKEPKALKVKTEKVKKAKKINLTIAPGNWTRLKKYLQTVNDSENRVGAKLNYSSVINNAIGKFISPEVK